MSPLPSLSRISIVELNGFDDPAIGRDEWDRLLRLGDTDEVFLSWDWQRVWWNEFGGDRRLLLLAARGGAGQAIAPFFTDSGMIYFVGSGDSDYLDFIGDISDPDTLDALLLAARERAPGFLGFVFFLVPETSRTPERLQQAATRLGMRLFQEASIAAPSLSLLGSNGLAATNKKSLVRHEAGLRRDGCLEIHHFRAADAVLASLPGFFDEHISRSDAAGRQSLFLHPAQRRFYERLAMAGSGAGWLRFTRIDWDMRAIAHHFGFCHRGRYLWYKPSFAIDLARRSPGEVLLRHLILAALDERAHTFDFGIGEEAFKARFATHVRQVSTWGMYPE
jgi:CelD/BcsL family acetyltransferase involved in cellulose biosynthesis